MGCMTGHYRSAPVDECPAGKFVFFDGLRCCDFNFDKQGAPLARSAATCKDDAYHDCPADLADGGRCKEQSNAKGIFWCKPCAAGKIYDVQNAPNTTRNADGQFHDESGDCRDCPAGQYQSRKAELSCTSCGAGQFQDVQYTAHDLLNDVYYAGASSHPEACVSCPAGQFQEVAGQLSCARCFAGMLLGKAGQNECTTVPIVGSLAAIVIGALAFLLRRRIRRQRALRDGTRDDALLASYIPPKDISPGSKDAQLRLMEIEAQLARTAAAPGELRVAWNIDNPEGDMAECFEEVRVVLDEAAARASRTQLRAVARCAGTEHKAAYAACLGIVQIDEGYAGLLEAAAAAEEKLASGHPHQTIGDLYELQMQARRVLPAFEERMERGVVAAFAKRKTAKGDPAVQIHKSPPKHLYRCMEKMCLKPGPERFTCVNVCDVVRCIIQCDDCGLMAEVLQALLTCPGAEVNRVKDRAGHVTSMNWMDVMVNLTLDSDASAHVCEVQIVHTKMLVARSQLGGHGPYGKLRAANEILALRAAEPQTRKTRRRSIQLRVTKPQGRRAGPSGAALLTDRAVGETAALPTVNNPMRVEQAAATVNPRLVAALVSMGVQVDDAARGVAAAAAQCAGDEGAAAKLIASTMGEALRSIPAQLAHGQKNVALQGASEGDNAQAGMHL